ncbi:MAG: serine/threonine-protein kinase, partial [Myxococcota bacterium]|nr:serine/threonine-protein kinase [Myxococcota bacterium]
MKFCNACGRGNPPEAPSCERCGANLGGADGAPPQDGEPVATLEPGSLIGHGRYELVRALGQGGMGTVFLARDVRLNRQVAVKLLNPDLLAHPTARQRMEREAEALARLSHPNVVDIYDVLDHAMTLALVIEFIEGGTLTDRLADGAMPWEQALIFVVGILRGLQALHDVGLIHRDMKPDNVLIDAKSETPKITDLGVAHDAAGRGMTQHGVQLGTAEYMSPEQIRGGEIDHRADLYATGIVLYELLVGAVPFDGISAFD